VGGPSVEGMINDQVPEPPAAPSTRDGSPVGTGSAGARIVAGLLVLAFAGVTGLFAPFLTMASDGCYEGDARTICSAGGQQLVGTLPVVAAFVAAVLAVVGMSSKEGGGRGGLCLVAAPVLLAVAWVVSLAVAGG
jgi:hypothetical protein